MQNLGQTPTQFAAMGSSNPPSHGVGNPAPRRHTTCAGHDFVLFDEPEPSTSAAAWADKAYSSRPPIHDKPSFTQYRAAPISVGPGSAGGESPFSSPASRLEDDFAGPSSIGSHGSGTLSTTTGLPNRKRQRPNGSGHTPSSSINSFVGAVQPNGTLRSRSINTSHQSPSGLHNQPLPGGRRRSNPHVYPPQRQSITGLSDLAGPADDWSLADTSPQNPPSGSFGPLLGSLSLGGDGKEEFLPSLFPEVPGDIVSNTSQSNYLSPSLQTRSLGMTPSSSSRSLLSDTAPVQLDPTPAQQAFARQQVRQDLAGVDQRALRGPLRALAQSAIGQQAGLLDSQQGALLTRGASRLNEGVSDAEMESALRAAVNNFVTETESSRRGLLSNNARAPGVSNHSVGASSERTPSASPTSGGSDLSQAQMNLLFPGAVPHFPAGTNGGDVRSFGVTPQQLHGNALSHQQQCPSPQRGVQAQRPPTAPRRKSNSFDASFLPASRPWFNQSPPQSIGAPQGVGTQNAPGGIGMGQGTGWTGLPTNSFNASDLTGQNTDHFLAAALAAGGTQPQGQAQRQPLTRDRSGLTVSPQETFLHHRGAANTQRSGGWQGNLFSGDYHGIEQILAGGTLSGGSTSGLKPQLLRGNTVKPSVQQQQQHHHHQQQHQQQQQQQQQTGQARPSGNLADPMKSDSSASSGTSLFSPDGSDVTPDTDDEDERILDLPAGFPEPVNYQALAKQLQQQHASTHKGFHASRGSGPALPGRTSTQGGHGSAGAPRFLASSSSSSESEDDMPLDADSRGFPRFHNGSTGHKYETAPPPLLQNQSSSSNQANTAPLQPPPTRGRGLQGGYGYMPGSADSGLQVDHSFGASKATYTPTPNSLSPSDTNGAGGGSRSTSSMNAMDFSSGAQSQDEERLSPSIRSAAEVISPPHQQSYHHHQQQVHTPQQRRQALETGRRTAGAGMGQQQNKAAYGDYPLPKSAGSSPDRQRRASLAASDASQSSTSWQSEEDGEGDEGEDEDDEGPDAAAAATDSDESNYSEEQGSGARKNKKKPLRNTAGVGGGGGRNSQHQQQQKKKGRPTAAVNKARKSGAGAAVGAHSSTPMYGHSLTTSSPEAHGQDSSASHSTTTTSTAPAAGPGGVSHHGNLTVCEYLSPLTGARCGTVFHRPYDLARHRETIHAKEEATLVRQGKLSKNQCRVLFVEVDPEKSQATQEWKCDGRAGCGSVFSRKDALQRHRRLRGH